MEGIGCVEHLLKKCFHILFVGMVVCPLNTLNNFSHRPLYQGFWSFGERGLDFLKAPVKELVPIADPNMPVFPSVYHCQEPFLEQPLDRCSAVNYGVNGSALLVAKTPLDQPS